MPESNKAAKRRIQKANREAGIGDESGRMVREKAAKEMVKCTVCGVDMAITKTCADMKSHAESKHDSTLEACFPGSEEKRKALVDALEAMKKGPKKKTIKAQTDLPPELAAAMAGAKKKKKKKKPSALATAQGAAKAKVGGK